MLYLNNTIQYLHYTVLFGFCNTYFEIFGINPLFSLFRKRKEVRLSAGKDCKVPEACMPQNLRETVKRICNVLRHMGIGSECQNLSPEFVIA